MQSRRDVGNEVIVALAVIGMLALALTFGVVLTLTRTVPPETTTPGTTAAIVASTESTGTTESTINPTAIAANTQVETSEATIASTATNTKTPTTEATRTVVATTQVPSDTPTMALTTEVPTDTPVPPTATRRKTRTPTATSIPATDTPTAKPTTALPTETPIPPTATPSKTRTRTPLPTVTPTPTASDTSTPTRIVDAGILPTPSPTITPTLLVSLTPTPLPTIAIATSCAPRADWIRYTVQPGDTLFSIALQAKITLAELQQANCISNPNTIFYGRVIVIPPGTTIRTVTPNGTVTASGTGNAALCPNPDVRITSPTSGSSFSGILSISGTARAANFANYQLEFLPEGTSTWVRTGYSSTQVTNGFLGRLDPNPGQLPVGNYSLRLRVETTDGKVIAPCVIQVKLVK